MMEMANMRNRKKGSLSDSLHALRKFDVYQKVHEDYQIKTGSGGLLSILAGLVIVALFVSELSAYLTVEVQDHIVLFF